MSPLPFDDLGSSLVNGVGHEAVFKDQGLDVLPPPRSVLSRLDFWAHPPLKEHHLRRVDTGFALKYVTTDGKELELDDSGEDACVEDCKSQLNPEKLEAEAKNPLEKYNNVLNPEGEMNMCITYCRDEFEVMCFPRDASVQVRDGGCVAMDRLVIGNEILVAKQSTEGAWGLHFDKVIGFLHRDAEVSYDCLCIEHEFGSLNLTHGHLVFVQRPGSLDAAVPARCVHVGDRVLVLWVDGSLVASTVTSIAIAVKQGAYAPLTNSGTILVDGAAASCYALPPSVLDAISFRALAAVTGDVQSAAHATMLPLRLSNRSQSHRKDTAVCDSGKGLRPQLRGGSSELIISKTVAKETLVKSSKAPTGMHPYAWGLYFALTWDPLLG